MEHTFMTIHNLTPDANILFASESVADILGYQPHEVLGKSCFDYFHPEEVPFARSVHSRGVLLDKAAVLHYCRVLARDGQWISCECCFTIVHDVLVACTSIYKRGAKSTRRAIEAPQIRRLFSSSARDPRYNMLEHLSPKFKMPPMEREPRAALILNRFTRNLTVMFATNAVSTILGVRPDQIQEKSFYECIAENCLSDAVKCLESAKANDSIAYLRFWYRDPRRDEDFEAEEEEDEAMTSGSGSDSEGGVQLNTSMDIDEDESLQPVIKSETLSPGPIHVSPMHSSDGMLEMSASSGMSSESDRNPHLSPMALPRRDGAPPLQPVRRASERRPRPRRELIPSFELEAVVSCTSDGLVVVLRKARPQIPAPHPPLVTSAFENGLFAAPWSEQPIRPYYEPEQYYHFQPPLLPQYMPVLEHVKATGGPPIDQLMRSIRDVAVFAWALVGINANLAAYSRGIPQGEAQPYEGSGYTEAGPAKEPFHGRPEQEEFKSWRPQMPEYRRHEPAGMPRVSGFPTETPSGFGSTSRWLPNDSHHHSGSGIWPTSNYSPGHESQPGFPQYSQPAAPPLIPAHHGLPTQDPWMEGTPSYHHPPSHGYSAPPTTQPQGSSGSSSSAFGRME